MVRSKFTPQDKARIILESLNTNISAAEKMGIANAIVRPKYENLQVYRTKGYHRKMMKRNFNWDLYHQRSKIETIFSVIKRMLGEYIMSRYILTQNRRRCIAL